MENKLALSYYNPTLRQPDPQHLRCLAESRLAFPFWTPTLRQPQTCNVLQMSCGMLSCISILNPHTTTTTDMQRLADVLRNVNLHFHSRDPHYDSHRHATSCRPSAGKIMTQTNDVNCNMTLAKSISPHASTCPHMNEPAVRRRD